MNPDNKINIIILFIIILIIIYFIPEIQIEGFKGASIEYGTSQVPSGSSRFTRQYRRGPYTYNYNYSVDGKTIPIVRTACANGTCTINLGGGYESDDYKKPDSGRYDKCYDGKTPGSGCEFALDNFYYQPKDKVLNLKSYKDFGFTCNLGNGTIPLNYNKNTGVLSCPSLDGKNCLSFSSKNECDKRINLVPYNSGGSDLVEPANSDERKLNNTKVIKCDNGKVGDVCTKLYNYAEMKTLGELGYSCNANIGKGDIAGKKNLTDTGYEFASYDGKNLIKNCPLNINLPLVAELVPIVCSEYNSSVDSENSNLCYQAFKEYNLFPSDNPLIIRGNNLNQDLISTITSTEKLKDIYLNYPNVFNDTNANYGDPVHISQGITNVLKDHPIMFYCCNRGSDKDTTVRERVPLDPTTDYSKYTTDMSKFGFDFKSLKINPGVCPVDLKPTSSACDNFMALHCENIFNQMTTNNIDINRELFNYAPECACYAPKKNSEKQFQNVPALCYKDRCQLNTGAYLDPTSYVVDSTGKKTTATCNMTICTNIVETGNISAGSADINPNLQNNCGAQIDAAKQTSTPSTPSTPSNPSTSSKSDSSTSLIFITEIESETESSSTTNIIIIVLIFLVLSGSLCSSSLLFKGNK